MYLSLCTCHDYFAAVLSLKLICWISNLIKSGRGMTVHLNKVLFHFLCILVYYMRNCIKKNPREMCLNFIFKKCFSFSTCKQLNMVARTVGGGW